MRYAIRRLFVLSALVIAVVIAPTASSVAASVPGAPSNVSASAGVRQATIHWSPPASNGGSAVDGYRVSITPPTFTKIQPAVSGVTDYYFTFSGLKDHTTYTLSVAAHNSAGYGPAVSRAVTTPYATKLTLSAPSAINYGRSAALSAHLSNVDTGASLSGRTIRLARRDHGTTSWIFLTSATTNSSGNVSFVVSPTRNEDYRVSFPGASSLGASSATRVVDVRSVVTAALSATTTTVNHAVTLSGKVYPNKSGQQVYVQQYVSGAWHNVVALTLNSSSAYSVSLTPQNKGTYTLRVVKPADSANTAGASPTVSFTAS